jgi:hypothetical protein
MYAFIYLFTFYLFIMAYLTMLSKNIMPYSVDL